MTPTLWFGTYSQKAQYSYKLCFLAVIRTVVLAWHVVVWLGLSPSTHGHVPSEIAKSVQEAPASWSVTYIIVL